MSSALLERWRIARALPGLPATLPEGFARAHAPLLDVCAGLLSLGRPLHVLEYGAGESEDEADSRAVSAVCRLVAERSRGKWWPVVCSERAGERVGPDERVVDGTVSPFTALAARLPPIDLFVFHRVDSRGETHPLSTFWAFVEAGAVAAETRGLVFLDCVSADGDRCAYVRDYLKRFGVHPVASGRESAWLYERPTPRLPAHAGAPGGLPSLATPSSAVSFLYVFDQVLSPLLQGTPDNFRSRAGTFRSMFETILAGSGPYVLVETGTTRPGGDYASNGQSTVLCDLFVNFLGGRVLSIDIDANSVQYCRAKVSQRTTVYCSDSVTALAALPDVSEAHLLYLDSYDFDGNNPHPSSLHHMYELAAVWGRTCPGALLVIDDCFGPVHGKHAYVSRFLDRLGIRPLFAGYQTAWII